MRNLTKESRLKSRDYQFNKELDFFTKEEGKYFTLKVFRGTSANHVLYMNYHTMERRAEIIQNYKNNFDRRQAYKAEQKEANKGKSSTHAGASAAIKAELKKEFPNTKFSVTSDTYSGGNSVRISWTDGPTNAEVEKYSSKYQYGQFNGMEDIYEYTNSREDIPQVKYVQESRSLSNEIIKEVATQLQTLKIYTTEQLNDYRESPEQEARQIIYKTEIPHNYTGLKVVRNTEDCSYSELYKIIFEVPESTQQEAPQYKEVEAAKGEINILDYSEKSFAIVGDTKPIKDKLKELGGSFNPRLSCGAGWIFSKKKYEEVVNALQPKTEETTKKTIIIDPKQGLKDEVQKMVKFFAETDIKMCGEITESTKECARVQNVSLSPIQEETPKYYNNLQDIEQAANSGKIISLCNLAELTNKSNQLTLNT
jgi:hypothetical protein